jgi:hypothetical protein
VIPDPEEVALELIEAEDDVAAKREKIAKMRHRGQVTSEARKDLSSKVRSIEDPNSRQSARDKPRSRS